jgi:hypothetical protein
MPGKEGIPEHNVYTHKKMWDYWAKVDNKRFCKKQELHEFYVFQDHSVVMETGFKKLKMVAVLG